MNKSSDFESLTNPATYLHAALRAFVSSAYEHVTNLLNSPDSHDVFNYGPNTPYPDLPTLHDKLKQAVGYWRGRNAFIADLIDSILKDSTLKHSAETDKSLIVREVFRPLTNYFFCYIKVDRRRKPVPTVRVLFPVDSDCGECPLAPSPSEMCANSCFRFAFFPYKPETLIHDKYKGHYQVAQFALADASFAAATPDLNSGSMSEVPLAALMVPLLLGQPLLLTDAAAEKEEYRVAVDERELVVRCRFSKMNNDLGLRSEALLPIKVARSFMPGFYAGLISADQRVNTSPEWVPEFENSCPFCIELYSPMPDWFAHAGDERVDHSSVQSEYAFQASALDPVQYNDKPPIPKIFSPPKGDEQRDRLKATWGDIGKVLALGFNLQHYSELMASEFVEWLRDMFTDSAYDPFAPTLRKRYKEHLGLDESQPLPKEVEEFLKFVTDNPDILADVLNKIHHGMLLRPNFAHTTYYDLSSVEDIKLLASKVDGGISVESLKYDLVPYCKQPLRIEELREALKTSNKSGVLSRLVAEVIKNHKREGQKNAIGTHACLDPDQHRYSLHLCSPDVALDLRAYLNLRQGLPHLRQGLQRQADRVHRSGIGLALSRAIAEIHGFEYVLGLGRDEKCTPVQSTLDVKDYRKNLHTRIYFGGAL